MKKILIFLVILFKLSFAHAQGCLPEGITFSTQAQIDQFQSDYPGCSNISGNVTISDVGIDTIRNVDGLLALQSISGNLVMHENYYLQNIIGLQHLTYVGGNLILSYNYRLASLEGFANLDSIGGNFSTTCTNLISDLSDFTNLSSIGGNLTITWNYNMVSLHGLENLNHLGGGLFLSINPSLSDLSALDWITTLQGDLYLSSNNALLNLEGLHNLKSIEGNLDLDFCDAMEDFSGLDSLKTIGGYLNVNDNFNLRDLSGLNALSSVGESLAISGNSELTSLTGLYGLRSIGGNLTVARNEYLTSLAGLDNIAAASISGLSLVDNPALSTCEVTSVCNYLAGPDASVYISNNATGCNNSLEVEDACLTIGVNTVHHEAFSLYPNPCGNRITLDFQAMQINGQIFILGPDGQELIQRKIEGNHTSIDIQFLPAGLYFVKILGDSGVQTGKFIRN